MLTRRDFVSALAFIAGVQSAHAQGAYPDRPIRILVGYPAGGGVDIVARLIGDRLQQLWGHPVVVENRSGAGGNFGA